MTIDYDQLALEIWVEFSIHPSFLGLCEFARRYRAALVEKMEPVAYELRGTNLIERHAFDANCTPLYSLEDWKK